MPETLSQTVRLDAAQWEDFLARARVLGHEAEALRKGEEVVRYHTFPDILTARLYMSVAGPESRALRAPTFFTPGLQVRSRLGQGMHDRGESIVFAEGEMSETDCHGLACHMPGHIKSLSVAEKRIGPGEEWDPSVRAAHWGLSDAEELYCTVNVGRLIIAPGGRIVNRGNVFSLLCQELIIEPGAGPGFEIGILPTPFSIDYADVESGSQPGHAGGKGGNGKHGQVLQLAGSLLGEYPVSTPPPGRLDGKRGGAGEDGGDGTKGLNGGMCKAAEITIRRLSGQLRLFSQAGTGHDGGNGGPGGDGGRGGDGMPGYLGTWGNIPAGIGGDGGPGGAGGKGGNAGHGGLASNIYLNLPADQTAQVQMLSLPGKGGKGGTPGTGGTGGAPGSGGAARGKAPAGADGKPGADGSPGKMGVNGRNRHAAALFLNDRPAPQADPHFFDLSFNPNNPYLHEK